METLLDDRVYADFSEDYLHRVAASYASLGCFFLICRSAEVEPTTVRAVRWLKRYRLQYGDRVSNVLETLTQREQTLLILRYGLLDPEQKSLESIGKCPEFSLSRQGVHHVERRALTKLRHPTRLRKLTQLIEVIAD